MFTDLLNSSYFALFLIVALGFMLGRIKIKGLSLDVSAVIFIALLFGHFGVIIPKELGNFGLVLFIFTIGGTRLLRLLPEQREDPHHHHPAHYLLRRPYGNGTEICLRHRHAERGGTHSRSAYQYAGTCRCH